MSKNDGLLVTIGIPTYNRADGYLGQALESALNQTYENVEVIVSDNCSTDDTEAVVRAFSDPRLRYFRHDENIGANNNFNFCVEQAQGDYFLLLHDDDKIDPDFVEVCIEAANYRTDVGIIRTGTHIIDSQGNLLKDSLNRVAGFDLTDFFIGWFRGKTALYLCSTLFNTQRLREIGCFNSKHQLFQDNIAIAKLATRYGRVDVRDAKASFRKHGATRTFGHRVSAWCEDSLMLLEVMCDLVPPEKASLVRREGARYFSKINYGFASKIESPIERWTTYFMVCRMFGYRYSPLYFSVYQKTVRRILRSAGKAKRLLMKVFVPRTT